MTIAKKADFIIENKRPVYPNITTDGLVLYYDAKGKENSHTNRENLVDMSGNGNHGELYNFAYENFSGYRDGLIFDGIDDKLVRPDLDIPEDNFTFQLNGNIISFSPDGTVKRVQDGEVIESKGFNLLKNGDFSNGTVDWVRKGSVLSVNNNEMTVTTDDTNMLPGAYYNIRWVKNHKIYARADLMAKTPLTVLSLYSTSTSSKFMEIYNPIVDTWHTFTGIITAPGVWDNVAFAVRPDNTSDLVFKVKNVIGIDLTETFGAGNEPTKEQMDAMIDRMGFIPNPQNILDRREYTHNFLGDMEGIIDDMDKGNVSGTEIFTDKADNSIVHVEVDGKSYQHAGSGKNLFVPTRLKESHTVKNESELKMTRGSEIFYPIDALQNQPYTFSFNYKHDLNYAPIFMSFYYDDGSSDGGAHGLLSETSTTKKIMTSKSDKKVVGLGYNAPTIIGVRWDKSNTSPEMSRMGVAFDTPNQTLGVSWDKANTNPIMERVGGLI